MVKKGRFTVELVSADTKVAFQEHAKGQETFVEVEPEAEYFVRLSVDAGPKVRGKISVDGKGLGYITNIGTPATTSSHNCGLYSFDGISSTVKALMFAKAKIFNSGNDDDTKEKKPFWTGNVTVEIFELFETGTTYTAPTHNNTWKGGDVGFVIGQADPKKKGVMTAEGNLANSVKDNGVRAHYTRGRLLETINLNYCSTVGLIFAGVLGPVNPMLLARKLNEHKRGRAQVEEDAEIIPSPQKIRLVQELNGQSIGGTKECDLYDLSNED